MLVDRGNLTRFSSLRLASPGAATALQMGDRRSPFRGRGVEFADYRPYDPGDDVRLVDWNVYLRLGLAVVRQFNEERSLAMKLCVDTSESMAFGEPRKADHAAQLAAALALVALTHRDPVGLCFYGGERRLSQTKASNLDGLAEILHVLERVEPGGRGDAHADIVRQLGQGRSDRLVLITDLLLEDDARDAMLRLIAVSSRHPVVLHVLSEDELRPDFSDVAKIVDAETGEEFVIRDDAAARRDYQRGLEAWLSGIEQRCRGLGIRYVPAFTRTPVPELFNDQLRRARVVEHAFGGA
ncbi:DUF58 domain-containing protein [Paraliomyxa miuraensis]|uniref:DUF58 domain-containing protein n=1 Tax=Paraliomyxa miuraensis TaxID=376150 RepID=UPI00224D956E|nr:DUF58 domain-containing protein [Paraliomyxa miuraensis]MCX4243112.1 DUF58 domain-containing protein [Paraliomyxa miuraensis]